LTSFVWFFEKICGIMVQLGNQESPDDHLFLKTSSPTTLHFLLSPFYRPWQ
jgi:hypothetical protein